MMVPTITGYADRFSVRPGEPIEFKISSEVPGDFHAEVVRLINGDTNPDGPGSKEVPVETPITGEYPGRVQRIHPGSYVKVEDHPSLALERAGGVHAFVMPTAPAAGTQTLISRWEGRRDVGWWLGLEEELLTLWLGSADGVERVTSSAALQSGLWYSVTASWDMIAGVATLSQVPVPTSANSRLGPAIDTGGVVRSAGTASALGQADVPLLIAASHDADGGGATAVYNGKIDQPKLYDRALTDSEAVALARGDSVADGCIAHWDFAADITRAGVRTDRCTDVVGERHGRSVNLPYRAMTGWNWDGTEHCYLHAPEQYGAIHFHDDSLEDAGWETDVTLVVPETLGSDVYALRVTAGEHTDAIPFWVLPPADTATADVLFVFPTASYVAYGNDHVMPEGELAQIGTGHLAVMSGADFFLTEHTEYGISMYDAHNDGGGVGISTRLRPLLTVRPNVRSALSGSTWQFPADLHVIDWLNETGVPYDVATDEDLDAEGSALLSRYKAVITGTHPEYSSGPMLDAYEQYLTAGGRVMSLGANGFYWVVEYDQERRHVIELRRGDNGVRTWQSEPGEHYHAFTGSKGGLWRYRGRAPQKLFGVGFTSQGMDAAAPYRTLTDWADPSAEFIVKGLEGLQVLGDFGLSGGGAAGYEMDRYDLSLGTPPHALLLATSAGEHSDNVGHVPEEQFIPMPGTHGTQDYQVRSDLVYFTTRDGGAVLSTGSISWCGALSHNGYDNAVSRITENVLRAFVDAPSGTFPGG